MLCEVDISGNKYNYLTAIKRVYGYADGKSCYWLFRCDCGKESIAKKYDVTHSIVKSCGCMHDKLVSETLTKHGKNPQRLYNVWNAMIKRCYGKKAKNYKIYGGRGIKICDEWLGEHGFENFRDWSFANGYNLTAKRGKCTIDRIDNNGNYEPSNCRWVDMTIQGNNRSYVHKITYNGETHTATEWSRITGISDTTIKDRLFRQKLPPEVAFIKNDRRFKNCGRQGD